MKLIFCCDELYGYIWTIASPAILVDITKEVISFAPEIVVEEEKANDNS